MKNSQTLVAFSPEGSWAPCFGFKIRSLKRDVAVSDFQSAFALYFFLWGDLCPKATWENVGCGQGLQTDRVISLLLCVLVTYAVSQEFTLVTPVRQENLRWSQVCPFCPWKHAVMSLRRHKRQWLCSQCRATFQGALLALLLRFEKCVLSLCSSDPQLCQVGL